MRLLVVNANTSAAATVAIADAAHAAARPGTHVAVVAPDHGPEGIDGPLDLAVAAVEVAGVIAERRDEHDAFVIACGNDPGLDAARQVAGGPVVGIAEAGMLLACTLGARFSIPVLSSAKVAPMVDLVRRYGVESRLASVVPMRTSTAEAIGDPEALLDGLIAAGRVARDRDLAEVFVLTGSAMAPLAPAVQDALELPVVAGVGAAVMLAETLVALGVSTSRRQTYRIPTKRDALRGHPLLQGVYSGEELRDA